MLLWWNVNILTCRYIVVGHEAPLKKITKVKNNNIINYKALLRQLTGS